MNIKEDCNSDIIPDNNEENEIAIRNQLYEKVLRREKLTPDEKLWLDTHREFSRLLGIPYLKSDVIYLDKDTNYQFHISFLGASHPLMIAPCFKAPAWEGSITSDAELFDFHGKKSKSKDVKMLVTRIHKENKEFTFLYHSKHGAICVCFECMYDDPKMHLQTGGLSSDSEGLYMLREDVVENKVIYRCKAVGAAEFDSLVFQVEWKPQELSAK